MIDLLREAAVIDYETTPIRDRPLYPPSPAGVSVRLDGKTRYYAWGHPSENTCSWGEARRVLGEIYESRRPVIFHHAKFDTEVGEACMGLPPLSWERVHDTMTMLFLHDPRAESFGLKPAAEAILGLAPEERDAVNEWLIARQPVPGKRLGRARGDNYAGAYVAFTPGRTVAGPYANGDADRTWKLAEKLYKDLAKRKLLDAYERERKLNPILVDMEQQGVRVNLQALERDVAMYDRELVKLEDWLRKKLRAPSTLNFDSGQALAEALITGGVAYKEDFGVTATGKMQTNKEALTNAIREPQILNCLKYRAQLKTCLNTFMRPWLETASQSGGYIFTEWHSTRNGEYGTSTGRLSSTPNFQNIPNEFPQLFHSHALPAPKLPAAPYKLPDLPRVRSYIIPYERGHVLLDRDYSQQELRILGHFEGGVLMKAYLENPWLDVHDLAQQLINKMLNRNFDRKPIKNTGFGLIYGMGVGKLADKNNMTVDEAKQVKEAYLKIFPGLKGLYAEAKRRMEEELPIRTWGNREYYCEPEKLVNGRMMKFDYKLPNVLIQGSAADCSKEALIRYYAAKPKHHKALLTVHDEFLISAPYEERHEAMELLKTAMESIEFDVPMLSEGSWSRSDWYNLEDYDTKGERKAR